MTKNILIGVIASLGITLGTLTTQAQNNTQYHPRYKGNVVTVHNTRTHLNTPVTRSIDPKAVAINKTTALDKKVGLTQKQERKIYRLYKKEAKQENKLHEIRKENKHAMREILTKEQYAKVYSQHSDRNIHQKMVFKAKMNKEHKNFKKQSKSCDKACCNKK
jgi:hypothetical protein